MADAFGYAKQKQEYVMKILVVGGTGLIGGHAALHLQSLGHEVTIAARHSAQEQSALASLPILIGDYVANDFTREQLADFDALVFADGNDIRHIEKDADEAAHWQRDNRSEEHTSELHSLMRLSNAAF